MGKQKVDALFKVGFYSPVLELFVFQMNRVVLVNLYFSVPFIARDFAPLEWVIGNPNNREQQVRGRHCAFPSRRYGAEQLRGELLRDTSSTPPIMGGIDNALQFGLR